MFIFYFDGKLSSGLIDFNLLTKCSVIFNQQSKSFAVELRPVIALLQDKIRTINDDISNLAQVSIKFHNESHLRMVVVYIIRSLRKESAKETKHFIDIDG